MSQTPPATRLPVADQVFLERTRAATAQVLDAHLDPGEGAALLDYPAYQNVGDHLIWLGELGYLRRLGARVRAAIDERAWSARSLAGLPRSVPLLLTGGGNLGDLWPARQAFRERILGEHRDRRIVQLPQSIYFRDPANAARANAIFRRHPDFTLLVRDDDSLDRARHQLPDVRVERCHDMALGWTPKPRPRPVDGTVLVLSRLDLEGGGPDSLAAQVPLVREAFGDRVVVTDWGLGGWRRLGWDAARVPAWLAGKVPALVDSAVARAAVSSGFATGTAISVGAAVDLFAGASIVITDRLHAHVLAGLMGIPHVVLDNSYGKIGAVYRATTSGFSTAHFTSDLADALDVVGSRT